MIVVGLTGSIGMGKTQAAQALVRLGLPVHDADAEVHRLLGPGGKAVRPVAALFPDALSGNRIDRKRLGDRVFGDTAALRRLEAVLHPMVRREGRKFLMRAALRRQKIVVLDVPLLFESHGERAMDAVIVVSAPGFIQRQRVMLRPGMAAEKFESILARQMPDAEKRRRATYVVRTGGPLGQTLRQLRAVLRDLRRRQTKGWRSRHWPPRRLVR